MKFEYNFMKVEVMKQKWSYMYTQPKKKPWKTFLIIDQLKDVLVGKYVQTYV